MTSQAAQKGYGHAQRSAGTARGVEMRVLSNITSTLIRANRTRDTAYSDFVDALKANADIWRLFAQDLSHPANGLPMELRQRLFALAGFVHDETNRILQGTCDASDLCAINKDILIGLSDHEPVAVAS